jgi:hypothetical protein
MKRFFVSFFIVASLCFLTSCSFIDENFKDEPDLTTKIGILEEQSSASDDLNGTHVLCADEVCETALRSLSINLSSDSYLGNEVQVIGFVNSNDDVFEVTGISVTEILVKSDSGASLTSYKNTDFGIELDYYDDWEIIEESSEIIFVLPLDEPENPSDSGNIEPEKNDVIIFSQSPFQYNPVISPETGEQDNPLSSYFASNMPEYENVDSLINKIGVNKLESAKIEKSGEIHYFLYRNGFIYKISFLPGPDTSDDNKRMFNEVISSFNFIGFTVSDSAELDINESNDEDSFSNDVYVLPSLDISFSTYESLPLAFTGELPSNWYYLGTSGKDGSLWHYGFSDEPVTDDNELIGLDVYSGESLNGAPLTVNGKEMTIDKIGGKVLVSVVVSGRTYKLSGSESYRDMVILMAHSIEQVSN